MVVVHGTHLGRKGLPGRQASELDSLTFPSVSYRPLQAKSHACLTSVGISEKG